MLPTVEVFKTNTYETTVVKTNGRGEKILLIHGIACTKEIFFLYPLLFPEHNFIAYDLRGFGTGIAKDGDYHFDKYVDDALAIIKHYNPDKIIAHSYGGVIAQRVSYLTKKPVLLMQTSVTPPVDVKHMSTAELERYATFLKTQIRYDMYQAALECSMQYLTIPFSLIELMKLMRYNPAMPAMKYLRELFDFPDMCKIDSETNAVAVFGGKRDKVVPLKYIYMLGSCVNKKPEIFNVNHLGIMYPWFVSSSVRVIESSVRQ